MCMIVEEFTWHSSDHDKREFNQKINRFTCNNCCEYTLEQPTRNGYQNPFNHLKLKSKGCCGGEKGLTAYYQTRAVKSLRLVTCLPKPTSIIL